MGVVVGGRTYRVQTEGFLIERYCLLCSVGEVQHLSQQRMSVSRTWLYLYRSLACLNALFAFSNLYIKVTQQTICPGQGII